MSRALGFGLAALGAVSAAACLAIGGWGSGAWGPRIVPLLASLTLGASGLAVALSSAGTETIPPSPDAADPIASDHPDLWNAAWLLALAVLYVLLIERIGYLLATALAAPAAFWLFGVRRPWRLLLAALVVPLALHVAFFRLLGVFPPLGRWFDLLDVMPL